MKSATSLLHHFNTKDTLLVITSYPNPINGKYGKRDFNAIGEHSERRLPYLAKKRKVLVAAEDLGTIPYFSPSPNLLIARVWKKGKLLSFMKLFSFIKQQNSISTVLVQFEFNVWGGIPSSLMLLAVLGLLRLSGKKIIVEMHQVTTDIGKLSKHVHISGPLKQFLFNTGLRFYYTTTGLIAKKVIVFEQELKNRLSRYIPAAKIQVLSLSVDHQKTIKREAAMRLINKDLAKICPAHASSCWRGPASLTYSREMLRDSGCAPTSLTRMTEENCTCLKKDEFILLVFGYINGYKGIDWITEALKDANSSSSVIARKHDEGEDARMGAIPSHVIPLKRGIQNGKKTGFRLSGRNDKEEGRNDKKIRLVVAGGENPYLRDKPFYQQFYQQITNEIKKYPHMTHTGFIPDEDVSLYYSAADLVIMPYEVFMSASGPFSRALAYHKPLILSDRLHEYAKSNDVKQALASARLSEDDLFFPLNKSALLQKIQRAQESKDYLKQLADFTTALAASRSIENITLQYDELLFSSPQLLPLLSQKVTVLVQS